MQPRGTAGAARPPKRGRRRRARQSRRRRLLWGEAAFSAPRVEVGVGRKDTARSGSRERGEARPDRRSGSRWAARVQEARDPPPTPCPRHGLRKRRGHSHGCAGLQGPRAVGTLGVARPASAAAAAVPAAGACPSLRSAAPPRWAPPPALPSGSGTRKGRPQLAPPSRVTRQSGLPTVSTSLWEGRLKGDRRCLREPGSFLGTARRP